MEFADAVIERLGQIPQQFKKIEVKDGEDFRINIQEKRIHQKKRNWLG